MERVLSHVPQKQTWREGSRVSKRCIQGSSQGDGEARRGASEERRIPFHPQPSRGTWEFVPTHSKAAEALMFLPH